MNFSILAAEAADSSIDRLDKHLRDVFALGRFFAIWIIKQLRQTRFGGFGYFSARIQSRKYIRTGSGNSYFALNLTWPATAAFNSDRPSSAGHAS
jgi:hypothetical protein